MASGSKKHFGQGSQGKGAGAGAMTTLDKDKIEENAVLSNRDRSNMAESAGWTAIESSPINFRITPQTGC